MSFFKGQEPYLLSPLDLLKHLLMFFRLKAAFIRLVFPRFLIGTSVKIGTPCQFDQKGAGRYPHSRGNNRQRLIMQTDKICNGRAWRKGGKTDGKCPCSNSTLKKRCDKSWITLPVVSIISCLGIEIVSGGKESNKGLLAENSQLRSQKPFVFFLLHFAFDAQCGNGPRLEPLLRNLSSTLLADAKSVILKPF